MIFKEAIEHIHKGGKVRRKSWPPTFHLACTYTPELPPLVRAFRQDTIVFSYDLSIILSDDWIIIGEDDKHVKFEDAIEALKIKKCVRLSTWDKNEYLLIDNNELVMKKFIEHPYVPTFSCFTADDWETM